MERKEDTILNEQRNNTISHKDSALTKLDSLLKNYF